MKRLKFIKETNKDIWALIPTIAITKEETLHSAQFYFLCFRFAVVWGKDLC